jgi:hypothetical protein
MLKYYFLFTWHIRAQNLINLVSFHNNTTERPTHPEHASSQPVCNAVSIAQEEFEDTKRGNQNPYIEEEQTTQWPK